MADQKHPYISSTGAIAKAVTHFRKTFPTKVDSKTLKKLGLAPNNESYLIKILNFVDFLDDEGRKTDTASKIFSLHKDEEFQSAFAAPVKKAYAEIFELHGDAAWKLEDDDLISFFRQTDDSTEIVGKRQSATFKTLAGIAGNREAPATKTSTTNPSSNRAPRKKGITRKVVSSDQEQRGDNTAQDESNDNKSVSLTVRVEINVPANATQEAYDRMFKSIRQNLIDDA